MGAVRAATGTDFALVAAEQAGSEGKADTYTLAASAPGSIRMNAGSRYAQVEVRLERWDGRPPPAADEWEDEDELPWMPAGSEPLRVGGFDGGIGDGLDVTGLGRARVQILAAGRYQHRDDALADDRQVATERWLLRLWPDSAELDALSGRPRRLAAPLPFGRSPNGWHAALRQWTVQGWDSAMFHLEPFRVLQEGLSMTGGPCSSEQLASRFGPWASGPGPAPEGWDAPAVRPSIDAEDDVQRRDQTQRLADAAGMSSVETFRDALECMRRLNLVLPDTAGRYVANPAPAAAWEVLPVDTEQERQWRDASLSRTVGPLMDDLRHLVRWAPDQTLRTTPRRIAVRQSIPVDVVLRLLELVASRGYTDVTPTDPDEGTEIGFVKRR